MEFNVIFVFNTKLINMDRKIKLLFLLGVLVFTLVVVIANRDSIIREHLENVEPSTSNTDSKPEDCCKKDDFDTSSPEKFAKSIKSRFDTSDKKIDELTAKFDNMQRQGQSQTAQAEAAKASLSAAKIS